jgi:DNA-directed RNA polymerase specialized sigma subunit
VIEIVDTSINSLPYGTASQTENAILKILSELELLREETRQLREENQDLKEGLQAAQDRITSLEAIVASQAEKITALESTELCDVDRLALDIAHDRQRISRLECKDPEPQGHGAKVKEHLNVIYDALEDRERSCKGSVRKWDFMTFWEVEELLGLSHRRISQLANIAKNDPRFTLGWHPKKKNTKIFELNLFRPMGHAAVFMNELSKKIGG